MEMMNENTSKEIIPCPFLKKSNDFKIEVPKYGIRQVFKSSFTRGYSVFLISFVEEIFKKILRLYL